MRLRYLAAAAGLSVAAVPLLTTSASSLDTFAGAIFEATDICSGPFTALQTSSGAPRYTVTSPGVVTAVKFNGDPDLPATRGFRLARPTGNGTYTIVGATNPVLVPAGDTHRENVRIPTKAGDVLGLFVGDDQGETLCVGPGTEADTFDVFYDDLTAGSTTGPADETGDYGRFPVLALMESDADGDGYGDTTQDRCPTQATTQGTCKDLTPPETLISSVQVPRVKGVKHKKPRRSTKVTVSFGANEAATYTCSVDRAPFTACANPLNVVLKLGRHTILVRATDAAGNADATPAGANAIVKKADPKKRR